MVIRCERGQFVVMLALMILALLGCAALATDLGYFEFSRLKLQNVADAAALAGELEIVAQRPGNARAAALDDAAANGFVSGVRGNSLVLNSPPASGSYAGDAAALEVIVTQPAPVLLLRALGYQTFKVTARAVARQKASPICVIGLNRSASAAIQFTGTAPLRSACAIVADSTASNAFSFDADLTLSAPAIGASGAIGGNALAASLHLGGGVIPLADPFAAHALPKYSGCDHLSYRFPATGKVVLTAGVFCNGISGPSGSTATLVFRPGLYVIRGGGIAAGDTVRFCSSVSGGDGSGGVTFYLTGDSSYPYGGVTISAGNGVLTAPRSGPFEGLLFFQNRTAPGAAAADKSSAITGGAQSSYQGVLYFPVGNLTFGGGASAYTVIVADTISFALVNPTAINADYSSLEHGAPVKTAVLAE